MFHLLSGVYNTTSPACGLPLVHQLPSNIVFQLSLYTRGAGIIRFFHYTNKETKGQRGEGTCSTCSECKQGLTGPKA